MTDPTPTEALKNLRHALIHVRDQLVALDGRTKGDCARLGDIRWHINQALAATPPPPDVGEVREKVARAKASLLHLEMFAEGDDIKRVRDAIAAIALLAPSSTFADAGEVRTYREGVEMACKAFEQAIADGYQGPQHEDHQCKHGAVSDSDCIACYDNALTASIAAIRKLPGQPLYTLDDLGKEWPGV